MKQSTMFNNIVFCPAPRLKRYGTNQTYLHYLYYRIMKSIYLGAILQKKIISCAVISLS